MSRHRAMALAGLTLSMSLAACQAESEPREEAGAGEIARELAQQAPSPIVAAMAAEAPVTTETAEKAGDVEKNEVARTPENPEKPANTAPAEKSQPSMTEAKVASAPAAAPSPSPVAAAMARPAAFTQCTVCHSDVKGQKSGFGPNLFGVAGTRAGELPGYAFSTAMKESGVTWTRANLDAFIAAPQSVVKGTRMAYPGMRNEAQRKAIVDYLMQLK